MDGLTSGLVEAGRLLFGGNPEVWEIIFLSLRVSLIATTIALFLGLPAGATLALARFPGRSMAVGAIYAGMGLPPIVAGLLVSLLLWRNGPFGATGFLYTPTAMILAQALIATPIVAGLTLAAVKIGRAHV